ncbi:MAG: iron ABC transporter substrate-binding protein, partial [Clostridia bacterium]|nr:iron ABC transporter substrate-binding protein [Clostridia bacterium]
MKFKSKNLFLAAILILLTATLGCSIDSNKNQVVIYTSVDQVFSEPVLKAFESETGIRVLPVYDVEATKTVGLVNRLIAEKSKPQADVFWNGEFVQTLVLKEKGLLEKYKPSGASGVPAEFVDSEG